MAAEVETPSGKGTGDENFPVGSWLLPKALRPDVAIYYALARAIDDIADNPTLAAADKVARLEGFAAAITGAAADCVYAKGHRLREMFDRRGIPKRHALDLISAFIQDATKSRYADWAELIGYCQRSAAPVGRFLLDLHGEESALYPLSDALCNALQVINHLQDCGQDYAALNRVYLPTEWLEAEGASTADLALPALTPGLRRTFDRALEGIEQLLIEARKLPKALKHRRLAAETAVIIAVAEKIARRLASRDPLARRVALGPFAFGGAAISGLLKLWLELPPVGPSDIDQVRIQVKVVGSSFYWAMRVMPRRKRNALFAIYAFCRDVDDIADGDLSRDAKIAALYRWRQKIDEAVAGRASGALTRVLADAIRSFSLRHKDLIAVIEGMEMDARDPIVAPSQEDLDLYCDRVAGAVGRLCVRVFGEPEAGQEVADCLGRALQLTNILRDVGDDAAIGRLYLPREALDREGLGGLVPAAVARDPRLPHVMASVGAKAEEAFAEAERALASCDRAKMRPAVVMMMVYRRYLDRLRANGWRPLPPRTSIDRARAGLEKLWIALYYGLF